MQKSKRPVRLEESDRALDRSSLLGDLVVDEIRTANGHTKGGTGQFVVSTVSSTDDAGGARGTLETIRRTWRTDKDERHSTPAASHAGLLAVIDTATAPETKG